MRISELRADIEKWEAAAAAVARSKSYVVDGLTYTRQDLAAIEKTLEGCIRASRAYCDVAHAIASPPSVRLITSTHVG